MQKVFITVACILSIYIILQTIYSAFYFRRAAKISKVRFEDKLEKGVKDEPRLNFTVTGDSVGVGVGATIFDTSLAGRLVSLLSEKNYVIFNNLSKSGAKMSDLESLQIPTEKQNLIVIVISSNDLFRFTNPNKFKTSTKNVLEKYSKLSDKVVVVGPGRVFDAAAVPIPLRLIYKIQAPKYAQILNDEAQNFPNISHINPVNPPVNPKNYKGRPSFDRFHPSDDDYIFWFDMVKTAL